MNVHLTKDHTCHYDLTRNNSTYIYGSCIYTLVDDLDGSFKVELEDILAYVDEGETEGIEIPLTLKEQDMLAEEIWHTAQAMDLWDEHDTNLKDWMNLEDTL